MLLLSDTHHNRIVFLSVGCNKLGYDFEARLTLVLQEDGTEVDDEDYFQCLDSGTVFLLLREGEKWKRRGLTGKCLEVNLKVKICQKKVRKKRKIVLDWVMRPAVSQQDVRFVTKKKKEKKEKKHVLLQDEMRQIRECGKR